MVHVNSFYSLSKLSRKYFNILKCFSSINLYIIIHFIFTIKYCIYVRDFISSLIDKLKHYFQQVLKGYHDYQHSLLYQFLDVITHCI